MATGNSPKSERGGVKKPPYFEEAIDLALLIVAVGSLLVAVSI
jgi:hypothetical protein